MAPASTALTHTSPEPVQHLPQPVQVKRRPSKRGSSADGSAGGVGPAAARGAWLRRLGLAGVGGSDRVQLVAWSVFILTEAAIFGDADGTHSCRAIRGRVWGFVSQYLIFLECVNSSESGMKWAGALPRWQATHDPPSLYATRDQIRVVYSKVHPSNATRVPPAPHLL